MGIDQSSLREIDIIGAYKKFYEALDINVSETWVEWICNNTYLNGSPFSFRGFEYLIQPINDNHPRQAIIKPAQVGASEAFARKMLAIIYRYATMPYYYDNNGEETCVWGINGIYSFPDTDNLRRFIKDRLITDIINPSPLLYAAYKTAESQAIDQLGIYNSFLYSTGRRTDSGNQSIPAEVVFIDEYDRPLNADRRAITALAARTQKAKIFSNLFHDGLIVNFSTPTFPDEEGRLIDGMYNLSDQHEWFVKCTRCGHWQIVEYPDSIAYFYEKGAKKPPKDPYWICLKCRRALDFSQIGNWRREYPNRWENAEWVAKYPNRTKDGAGIRGYRLPFATLYNTAKRLLNKRDTDYKHSIQDFYNYGLGRAYMDKTIGITDEDFVKNINTSIRWGFYDPNYPHIMAGDQGAYIVIARLKENSQTDMNPKGIWQVVYAEHFPDTVAFSRVEKDGQGEKITKGRIAQLIDLWKPEVVLLDRLPNVASAENEQKLFPHIFWLNDSKGTANERIRIDRNERGELIHHVTENKHECIDYYFNELRGKRWEFANGGAEVFEQLKAHNKNIKKIVDDKGVPRYISFGADHFGQAMKLLSEAAEIYATIKPIIKRVGVLTMYGFKEGRN